MARPYDRAVVAVCLAPEEEEGETYQFFVYGTTADEIENSMDGLTKLRKLLRARFPDHKGALLFSIYDPEHDLPINTIPHVYTQGRKAPEFV